MSFIVKFAIPGLTLITTATIAFAYYHCFRKSIGYKKQYDNYRLSNNNIISIIHSSGTSMSSAIGDDDNMITIKTHMDFIKGYERIDKNKDINIIMHTTGGSLSSTEAICNCILNHHTSGYQGKINMYIPYYSYSGGCMIALSCDKVVMLKNAILGPCDAQKYVGCPHSIAAIIDTANYKKTMKEKINETWLASSYDANLCKERQHKFVNKLIQLGKFSEDVGAIIYDEFFSGKYNHDKIFSAQEAKDLGLNIEICDDMPSQIKSITDDIAN